MERKQFLDVLDPERQPRDRDRFKRPELVVL
jgi:hypothetical protein